MPACFHIYNKGVEKRTIFSDDEDYNVFVGYLAEYLTSPAKPEDVKTEFTVNGRTYQGVPHQPKNYYNQVELIAYDLKPDHFHLMLIQKADGAIEKLMRSLCTRYSMYFNKKYNRRGRLLEGPYKSVELAGVTQMMYLTYHLHRGSKHSSYEDYMGIRNTSWVRPSVVLAFFDRSQNEYFKGKNGYRNFIENYELKPGELKILEGLLIDGIHETEAVVEAQAEPAVEVPPVEVAHTKPRIGEFLVTTAGVFVLLVALGIRNINTLQATNDNALTALPSPAIPTPQVAGVEEVVPEKVVISDENESVNIRSLPTVGSDTIGKAYRGDVFEVVNQEDGWYQVKLINGSVGYLSTEHAEIVGGQEQ